MLSPPWCFTGPSALALSLNKSNIIDIPANPNTFHARSEPACRMTQPPPEAHLFVNDYLPALLAQASWLISSEFHGVARAHGFSVSEWRVLASLAGGVPISIGRLAQLSVTKQPTVTRLLDRMQAKNHGERPPHGRDPGGVPAPRQCPPHHAGAHHAHRHTGRAAVDRPGARARAARARALRPGACRGIEEHAAADDCATCARRGAAASARRRALSAPGGRPACVGPGAWPLRVAAGAALFQCAVPGSARRHENTLGRI